MSSPTTSDVCSPPQLTLVRGHQTPRVFVAPPYIRTAGPSVTELCTKSNVHLDEWQQFVLEHGLGIAETGKWASRENGVVVPRQNGKGEIILARELGGLFLFGERKIIHTAHEFKTARDGFDRINDVIHADGNYHLRRRVKKVVTAHGEEGIYLHSGQKLLFMARSTGSGRGFSADCVILDEAFNLDERHMSALGPTLRARPNPQIWYFSSAPLTTSVQLHAVRGRALALAGLAA